MASSSYTLSLPLPSSARLGLQRALNYGRPLPSAGRLQTRTKGLRSVATTSYPNEVAGHGDNGGIAATTSALHLVAGDGGATAELMAETARVRGAGLRSPKRPGAPREGSGGKGGKVHAAPSTLLRRLPKEGSGGQG